MASAEVAGLLRRQGQRAKANILTLGQGQNVPAEGEIRRQKVEKTRFSRLGRWILLHTGDGIERGQIAEGFFEIARFYCGFYVDPCLTPREKHEREGRYKKRNL